MLMNAKLFYVGCSITAVLWLTGTAARKLEDVVDREGEKPLTPSSRTNEEQYGLIRSERSGRLKQRPNYGAFDTNNSGI